MQKTFVAVDVETTGLGFDDRIIEIGAVKFNLAGEVLAQYQTLINPHATLTPLIVNLTGISQHDVNNAPDLADVHGAVQDFLNDSQLVAHNAKFDMRFIEASGWYVSGMVYDTLEIAQILLPKSESYSLGNLAGGFGIQQQNAHRALDDADVTHKVFLELLELLRQQPTEILDFFEHLQVGYGELLTGKSAKTTKRRQVAAVNSVLTRVQENAALPAAPNNEQKAFETGRVDYLQTVEKIFAKDGLLSQVADNFQFRAVQAEMAYNIASTLLDGENLIAEAGTGVGKSLAYLIPVALHSAMFGTKAIIATYTINLQEQLAQKDINITRAVLKKLDIEFDLKVAILKGRENYVCHEQWQRSVANPPTERERTALLAKLLNWLPYSDTGDRGEINLANHYRTFADYSAQKNLCKLTKRPCFLHKARLSANSADIIITNHSLLLTSLLESASLLPNFDALVIDEAHHIVNVATNVLTFSYAKQDLVDLCDQILGDADDLFKALKNEGDLEKVAEIRAEQKRTASLAQRFFDDFDAFKGSGEQAKMFEMRVKSAVRNSRIWEAVSADWAELKIRLVEIQRTIGTMVAECQLHSGEDSPDELADKKNGDLDTTKAKIESNLTKLRGALTHLEHFVSEPLENHVYWIDYKRVSDGCTVNGAPIDVSEVLGDNLFRHNVGNVMIGAVLSHEDSLEKFKNEIGIVETATNIYGTDFDYQKKVLGVFVSDLPKPNTDGNLEKVAEALASVYRGVRGRVLVLFTAKTKMRDTSYLLKNHLVNDGVELLVQGVGASASQIRTALASNERLIAFGTGSFWEGVDIEDGGLDAVVVTHLPFPVPSDPIHGARSEMFNSPFGDYSIPEAIKRFRQGFGRLIRSHADKGVFVVLDSRILNMAYGAKFLGALPAMNKKSVTLDLLEKCIIQNLP